MVTGFGEVTAMRISALEFSSVKEPARLAWLGGLAHPTKGSKSSRLFLSVNSRPLPNDSDPFRDSEEELPIKSGASSGSSIVVRIPSIRA